MSADFWNIAVAETYASGSIVIPKGIYDDLPSPSDSGLFVKSVGVPRGQIADWRTFKDGIKSGVHAVEFRDRYELHVDGFDPNRYPVEHLIHDLGPVKAIAGLALYSILGRIMKRF